MAEIKQNGGVGKTTTVVNLAAVIAAHGKTVLVLDLDPQANATSGLGVEPNSAVSLYHALVDLENLNDVIVGTSVENVNIIPSEVDLAGAEVEIARMDDHLHGLQKVLDPIIDQNVFDYIIIDCPPSLGILMSNALAAADSVLIPMQCEYYAMEGLSVITGLVERIRTSGANPKLRIKGVLMTMYSHTRLADDVIEQVRSYYGDAVYDTIIPRSVRAGEAPSFGLPVVAYAPSSTVAEGYFAFGKEFLDRAKAWELAADKIDLPASPRSSDLA